MKDGRLKNRPRILSAASANGMAPETSEQQPAVQVLRLDPGSGTGPEGEIGFLSIAGGADCQRDYLGIALGNAHQRPTRGSVLALASGGGEGGMAETAVRAFLEAWYQLPETLGPERAARRALGAINTWLHGQSRMDSRPQPMVAFGALILRGRDGYWLGSGDIRLYRLRLGRLRQLSEDHCLASAPCILTRALGMDQELRADFRPVDLEAQDRLLLCSRGLYQNLSLARLRELLEDADVETATQVLLAEAAGRDAGENISAIVLELYRLPQVDIRYLERTIGLLPIRTLPQAGEIIDGFRLDAVLYEGFYSRLFLAEDQQDGLGRLVLKFPRPRVLSDENIRRAFVREGWIAGRAPGSWQVAPVPLPAGRQSRLYVAMTHHPGETLEALLRRRPVSLAKGIEIAERLARAIDALNRVQIFHRDIKPENVLLLEDGGLKLLDVGFAYLPGVLDPSPDAAPGTPAYMAPELLRGHPGDARSEVFALGVTLYRLFSGGQGPYGLAGRIPLQRHRPDLPDWLDHILVRAMAEDPARRYADVLELGLAIRNAASSGGNPEDARRLPWYERSPLRFWQVLAFLLLILLMLALAT